MVNRIEQLLSNKEYCLRELASARKIMTDASSTKADLDKLLSSLAFMYIYCPEEITALVLSQMIEVEKRGCYLL